MPKNNDKNQIRILRLLEVLAEYGISFQMKKAA